MSYIKHPSTSKRCQFLICCLFYVLCCRESVASKFEDADQLNAQAFALEDSGSYHEALALYSRVLTIRENVLGSKHLETAHALNNLANAYRNVGEYDKALPIHVRALSIYQQVRGSRHLETANSLNNVANAYCDLGHYENALPFYEQALTIYRRAAGEHDPSTALCLNNLATTYRDIGDYPRALMLHERALEINEKTFGPNHASNSLAWRNLAIVHALMGDYSSAIAACERAVAISEKNPGPSHPNTGVAVALLAGIRAEMGDQSKAIADYDRALKICEKELGGSHPDVAWMLGNIAAAHVAAGDHSKALSIYERALAIYEEALGREHPLTTGSLSEIARLKYQIGDSDTAKSLANREIAANLKQARAILLLDEKTRLSWQRKHLSMWYACILPANSLAELSLQTKGLVLDSLIEDRRRLLSESSNHERKVKRAEIVALRSRLARLAFSDNKTNETGDITRRISQLERDVTQDAYAGDYTRPNLDLKLNDINQALSSGSIWLDFIRFDDPKVGKYPMFYGALITRADGSSTFVRLGNAVAIDAAIDALRASITNNDASLVEKQNLKLSKELWQPLSEQIPEYARRLFISPDGKLNFLSFATLAEPDGKFVAERYSVAYIGSGRDLKRRPKVETAKTLAVFADPVFDVSGKASSVKEMVAMRSAEADVFGTINLPQLPGTKAEAEQLEVIAAGAGWDIKTIMGDEATESCVREVKKPGVLHLATHGFYLNSFSPPAEDGTRGMSVVGLNKDEDKKQKENGVDPMRASGVALTGAQQTLKLWSQRKAPDPETDGVLTAEEVASLNLDGTWLVTLSACETGVGEARSGEGVFGLRRAFMMAGAENLLMTLWPVADDTTASIMADFYREALATGDAPGSLAKVQRDWLVKLREEKGLAAAIREAGPFAMVMMTAPTHPPVELPAPSSGKSNWWPF